LPDHAAPRKGGLKMIPTCDSGDTRSQGSNFYQGEIRHCDGPVLFLNILGKTETYRWFLEERRPPMAAASIPMNQRARYYQGVIELTMAQIFGNVAPALDWEASNFG